MNAKADRLVSVLVPAYNAEATLAAAVQSALASSYSNLEVVLVDDGSTDETSAIAQECAREDKRVRVFPQAHAGVSAALNKGLAQARGDYVARLDSDDLWHTTKLQKQVALIEADPAVALVYTYVRYLDTDGRVLRDAAPQQLGRHPLCECLYTGIIGGGSSVLIRRSILNRIGGYDEDLSIWEDLLLHLRLAAAGEVSFVPEYLTGYRIGSRSSSRDLRRSFENWRLARHRIEAAFPQIPAFAHGWSNARRLLEFAEGFAFGRNYGTSAKLLADCVASDFARTFAFLAYRLHRTLSGNSRPLKQAGPLFDECCVTTNYCLSEFDAGLEGVRLRTLDESRARLLRSIDRRLAQRQV